MSEIVVGNAVLVCKRGGAYIGRVLGIGERFIEVSTPFKTTPRRAVHRDLCRVVDSDLDPQRVRYSRRKTGAEAGSGGKPQRACDPKRFDAQPSVGFPLL